MKHPLFTALIFAAGCRAHVVVDAPVDDEPDARPVAVVEPREAEPDPAPTDDAVGLVVRDDGDTEIELYAVYIVDEDGELGTRALWPHRFDCPNFEAPPHTVPAGGTAWLPAPTAAFEGSSCTPSPLPPGNYVIRAHSGHGEEFYASAEVTLPLTQSVELQLENHEGPPPCDATMARRAATLAVASAEAEGRMPADFMDGCDVGQARCGSLPLGDGMPPAKCTVTLHETLLRIERPAGTDSIRSLDAWVDRAVVYARRPDVRATSASRFEVEGEVVTLAGVTGRARHEHGGDAARIGYAVFEVNNPLDHDVPVKARKVEFLTDHGCALPSEVRARPRVRGVSPASLPPGRSRLEVLFEPQAAYQSHCDRFAARVSLSVAGQRAPVTVEYEVMRFERMR